MALTIGINDVNGSCPRSYGNAWVHVGIDGQTATELLLSLNIVVIVGSNCDRYLRSALSECQQLVGQIRIISRS